MHAALNVEQARFNMIEQQIRPWDVLDPAVLDLLATVRREDFVPAAHRALAFVDTQIPLGGGRTMLEPRVEARLLQALALTGGERVLEVGTGAGYLTALAAHRARRVDSLETDPSLARAAAAALQRAGIGHAEVHAVDASALAVGWPGGAPYDAIVVTGSVAEIPPALLAQLAPGGRLVAVVGDEPVMHARRVTKSADGGTATEDLFETVVPRLPGAVARPAFAF